jgi:hypothetical protein
VKRFLLLIAFFLLAAGSQVVGQQSSEEVTTRKLGKQRDSFADFALKQINPRNADYGCQIEEARRLVVHETLRSIDFWTALIALGFLVLSFLMLLYQRREGDRREIMAAQFMAQYHNALIDARRQAEDAMCRYNELVHVASRASDAMLPAQPLPESEEVRVIQPVSSRDAKAQSGPIANKEKSGAIGIGANDSGQGHKSPVRQNRAAEVDLIAQITALQQQLTASHEREKTLQRKLSKVQRQGQSEKEGNANLAS